MKQSKAFPHGKLNENVREDLDHLTVGESVKATLYDRTHEQYRAALQYAFRGCHKTFKTKRNSEGVLFVTRVA